MSRTDWPPERYTVLRVFGDGHRAELLGPIGDELGPGDEHAWRESYRPALMIARAYAEVTDAGDSMVVSFVVWERDESA